MGKLKEGNGLMKKILKIVGLVILGIIILIIFVVLFAVGIPLFIVIDKVFKVKD